MIHVQEYEAKQILEVKMEAFERSGKRMGRFQNSSIHIKALNAVMRNPKDMKALEGLLTLSHFTSNFNISNFRSKKLKIRSRKKKVGK